MTAATTTDQALAGAIGSMERGVGEIISKIGLLTEKYGEQTVELMTQGIALDGANKLGAGVSLFIGSIILWKISNKFKVNNNTPTSYLDINADFKNIARFIAGAFSLVALGNSLLILTRVSNWYSLIDPKVYVAYMIAQKILN